MIVQGPFFSSLLASPCWMKTEFRTRARRKSLPQVSAETGVFARFARRFLVMNAFAPHTATSGGQSKMI